MNSLNLKKGDTVYYLDFETKIIREYIVIGFASDGTPLINFYPGCCRLEETDIKKYGFKKKGD